MALTLQCDNALEELALQGHGVTGSDMTRYGGVIADTAGLPMVGYISGGLNDHCGALTTFLQQNILGDAPFAMVWLNGKLYQRDQNGAVASRLRMDANSAGFAR